MEILNKRGVSFYKDWAEIIGLILLVVGFILSLSTGSKVMSYLVITLSGLMFGRLWYRCRHTFKFTWALIIFGFLLGFLLGNMYGSKITLVILFLVGIVVSYYLHDKHYLKSVEY